MGMAVPSALTPWRMARTRSASLRVAPMPPFPDVRLAGTRMPKTGSSSRISPARLLAWHSEHSPTASTTCLPRAMATGSAEGHRDGGGLDVLGHVQPRTVDEVDDDNRQDEDTHESAED